MSSHRTLEAGHSMTALRVDTLSPDSLDFGNLTLSARLPKLPTDILLQIFEYIEEISSTCLGLTCKPLYRTHQDIHGKVKLSAPNPDAVFEFGIGI
ncbi:uncharacterized protein BP5553_10578 [Venustampulla echinocandica]|uniref:F-box domain-containing protein n=1 Tax=Venustampulla echinocandica TaxID=2656787 RepID=A0A370T901_9HELO|nr:uncharacterized protein BP5553_10578 [Venustampulla echinocandica]RDL29951.1 hypothetical protein BP5553_10578 [Venustampulla echinocandica]